MAGDNMYDLDIATEIIARMAIEKENAYEAAQDPEEKSKLKIEADVLRAEGKALYSDKLMQLSMIDKAFRLYAPILKAEYAAG